MKSKESNITCCPICGRDRVNYSFVCKNKRDDLNTFGEYVRCSYCTHFYLEMDYSAELSNYIFDEHYKNVKGNDSKIGLRRSLGNVVRKIIKRCDGSIIFDSYLDNIEKDSRVLEIGCGPGRIARQLIGKGVDYVGIDPSLNAIEVCKTIGGGQFKRGILSDFFFPENSFNYCIMDNVLEHISNPFDIAKEVRRILKKGGKFIINVPSADSIGMRLFKNNSLNPWVPFHLSIFSSYSIKFMLKNAGLNSIIIYFFTPVSYFFLTYRQIRLRKDEILSYDLNKRKDLLLMVFLAPIAFLLRQFHMGEQMLVIAN